MKSYNPLNRTLLKLSSSTMALKDAIQEQARNILLSQELKTKHNSIKLSFNLPVQPKTTFELNA
jgi:hypothetical protein